MTPFYGADVRITLGGVEYPASIVRIEREATPKEIASGFADDDVPTEVKHRPIVYEASGTIDVPRANLERLRDLLFPRTAGASDSTLARRIHYGGRKGRSAWRRLRAKGYVGTMTVNDKRPIPCPPVSFTTVDGETFELRGRMLR